MQGIDLKQWLKMPNRETDEKKKPPPILILGIIIAILFLAVTSVGTHEKKEVEKEHSVGTAVTSEEYLKKMEQRLETVLKSISGAGKVSVFINVENTGEKILATDLKTELEESEEERQKETKQQKEETVVFAEQDDRQSPYVVEEKMPMPVGILVIAEGARDESVKMEIYEAVKALFGLPAHRIKIAY